MSVNHWQSPAKSRCIFFLKCGFGDCDFEANYRTVLDHETSVHMRLGNGRRQHQPVRVVESAEDIAVWKAERRMRFPRLCSISAPGSASNSEAAGPASSGMRTSESHPFVTSSKTSVPRVTAIRNRNQRFNGREKRSECSKGRPDHVRGGAAPVTKKKNKQTLFQKLTEGSSCST